MSERPTLSLKKPAIQLRKGKMTPKQREKLAQEIRKERIKRRNTAFKDLLAMKVPCPIAKGAGKELVSQLRDMGFSSNDAKSVIQRLVTNTFYLEAVATGKCRYHLDGTEAEEITDVEREYSLSILNSRKKKKYLKKVNCSLDGDLTL